MKFAIYGTMAPNQGDKTDWLALLHENDGKARVKAGELGITVDHVWMTLGGPFDFIGCFDAPSPGAMLSFQYWYAKQGRGELRSMPAFGWQETLDAMQRS